MEESVSTYKKDTVHDVKLDDDDDDYNDDESTTNCIMYNVEMTERRKMRIFLKLGKVTLYAEVVVEKEGSVNVMLQKMVVKKEEEEDGVDNELQKMVVEKEKEEEGIDDKLQKKNVVEEEEGADDDKLQKREVEEEEGAYDKEHHFKSVRENHHCQHHVGQLQQDGQQDHNHHFLVYIMY